jgi:hypothetical protein
MRVRAYLAGALVVGVGACGTNPSETGPVPDAASPASPPPSAGHDLVYHDGLGVVLLVNAGLGGVSSPPSDQPTRLWAWDGERWSVVDSAGPPIRNLGGVAYDARRDVLVIHGGTYSAQLSYGDTWEWKQGSGWRRIDAPGPGIRDHTQMTYDQTRERIVLFGGQNNPSSFPRDTWTWDGGQWESVGGSAPTPRVHHAMQFDPVSRQVVLFGGYEPNVRDRGDT